MMALNPGILALRKAAASRQGQETSNAKGPPAMKKPGNDVSNARGSARSNDRVAPTAKEPPTGPSGSQQEQINAVENASKQPEAKPAYAGEKLANAWSAAADQARDRLRSRK